LIVELFRIIILKTVKKYIVWQYDKDNLEEDIEAVKSRFLDSENNL
jgi:hypothetical protein